jgi:Tol biopolymer transport system component
MRRVIWRALGAAALALLWTASFVSAAAPEGPRLGLVKLEPDPFRLELLSVDQTGAQPVRLAGGGRRSRPLPYFFSPLSWSSDGAQIAFSGIVGRRRGGEQRLAVFLVDSGAGRSRRVAGTANGFGPVLSPDRRSLAFTRFRERQEEVIVAGKPRRRGFEGAAIWILDLTNGASRQLTPWRNGLEYFASSFSPDGSTLLATRQDDRRTDDPEPVALDVASGAARKLLAEGSFPIYSPDALKIALSREGSAEDTDLYVLNADGSGLRRLTRTADRMEFFPTWDPSGERLAYMRFGAGSSEAASLGIGDALMQINTDGTCATRLLSAAHTGYYVPAWQPGPGREAGRIEC